MAKGFRHGVTGTALDFWMIAYGDEAELQADSPAEKTIGIVTEFPISGWVFSREEPEAGAEGMVWVLVGDRSVANFNPLKKNAIVLHPLSARQYRSGIWETVPAKSRKYGIWMDWWDGWLYHMGDVCAPVSGGWKAYAYKPYTSGSTAYAPTAAFQTDSLKLSMSKPSSGYRAGALFSEAAVDVSGYKKLCIRVKELTGLSGASVGIGISETKENGFSETAAQEIRETGLTTLDLSGVSGSYHIYLRIGGVTSSALTLVLDAIWLE